MKTHSFTRSLVHSFNKQLPSTCHVSVTTLGSEGDGSEDKHTNPSLLDFTLERERQTLPAYIKQRGVCQVVLSVMEKNTAWDGGYGAAGVAEAGSIHRWPEPPQEGAQTRGW